MKLSELRLFNDLVNNGLNISRTAHNNSMVQSGVTRKIQSLEESFGMPLVIRQGKKLIGLTDLGKKVLEESRTILLQVDNLQAIANDTINSKDGTLTIATTNTQASFFLPPVVVEFKKLFPLVKLHLLQGEPKQLIAYLYDSTADIAICTESLVEDPNLKTQACYQWNHSVIVHPNHPLAKVDTITLEEIAKHPILTYAFYLTGGAKIRKTFQNAGLSLHINFTALDSEVIKTYVRMNQGVGIIASIAHNENDHSLVCKPINHLIENSTTRLAWIKDKYLNNFTTKFMELSFQEGATIQA